MVTSLLAHIGIGQETMCKQAHEAACSYRDGSRDSVAAGS